MLFFRLLICVHARTVKFSLRIITQLLENELPRSSLPSRVIHFNSLFTWSCWIFTGKFEVLVNFLKKSFIILHDNFKLSILIDSLQRSHIRIVQQSKLNINSCSSLQKIENWDIIHLLVEDQISTKLRHIKLKIFFTEYRMLLIAIVDLS